MEAVERLTRFDKQEPVAGELLASLGNAAEEFTATVDRQVREIIESAEDRAAQIERDAQERAQQVVRSSEQRDREMRREIAARASQMLEGIEFLERGLGMLTGLREEVASLSPGLAQDPQTVAERTDQVAEASPDKASEEEGSKRPIAREEAPSERFSRGDSTERRAEPNEENVAPRWPEETGSAESEGRKAGPAGEHAVLDIEEVSAPSHEPEANGTQPRPNAEGEDRSELNGMIRGQIVRMHDQGKSRDEVERLLMRFKLGESYLGMLDDIYRHGGQSEPPKRRRFGRRRRDA